MRMLRMFSLFVVIAIIAACGGVKPLNLSSFNPMPQDSEMVNPPKECAYLYENKKWEVAVLEFANNTGYDDMNIQNNQTNSRTVADVEAASISAVQRNGRGGSVGATVAAGHAEVNYSSDSSTFMGEFAPSLGTFAQSVTEETLAQMGGVSLINRSFVDKILNEQKFQMTMADPDTVMEFGKLSGVKYIFTGSVNNIQAKYSTPSSIKSDGSTLGMFMSIASAGVDAVSSGWFVSASVTLNLIDAQTGKILYSKTITDKQRATQSINFQPDLIINTAKSIMSLAVKNTSSELANVFEMRGYINELRGGKQVAQINLGSKDGVKKGDIMDIYEIQVSTDFMTKDTKCHLIKTTAQVQITDQVSEESAWGYVIGGKENLASVKIGSSIKRTSVVSK